MKYKIEKKVREHHRKVRKEARKNPSAGKRLRKDPGIPNLLPYKEKLLNKIDEHKAAALVSKARRREDAIVDDVEMETDDAFAALVTKNGQRQQEHKIITDSAINGQKDNSKKAYFKDFKKMVAEVDVVLQVLDARDPLGCRSKQVEEFIMNQGSDKKLLLILNKVDLIPRKNLEAWLKYLRNELPTIPFKASTQKQRQHLAQNSANILTVNSKQLQGSQCLGAEDLLGVLKGCVSSVDGVKKRSITVGVIGYPNVGKSSIINSLKRAKVCTVGSTPGITKSTQQVSIDKMIKLVDCPGIVFAETNGNMSPTELAKVALRNCVKIELLDDVVTPVQVILEQVKSSDLIKLYSINAFVDVNDFLIQIAKKRGRLRKGGIPSIDAAARIVLDDWNNGRISFYNEPPVRKDIVQSSVVTSFAKEFDISSLPSTKSIEESLPMEE